MTIILLALPMDFNHFHSAWESTTDDKKNLAELRTRLMIEEKRLNSQSEQNESGAFVAKRFRRFERSNQSQSQIRKCFKCGSTSHLKKDCVQQQQQGSKMKSKSEALCCDALVAVAAADAWYLDSGATEHMSNRRELFYEYEALKKRHPVKIGNGEIMYGEGIGKIDVEVYDGNKWIEKHLVDVLYVPALHTNLFSQGRCLDKGYTLYSNSKKCFIRDGDRIVAMGVRETALYKMLIKPIVQSTSCAKVAVKAESIRVWHERFAHQNIAQTKKLLTKYGIEFVDEPNFQCEACVLGKHHRLPFKGHNATTTKCGELIHADVFGPFQVNSLGGARYVLLLKDDYSHMRYAYFLKAKSEDPAEIKVFVEYVHNQTKHKIKAVRSDSGGEFDNFVLKSFCESKGIKHEFSVAYTPEQNGTIERENSR